MAELFHEIDEELRKDQTKQLWQRYGKYLIAGLVIILLLGGGWTFWQNWQVKNRQAEAEIYAGALQLLADKQDKEALAKLDQLAKDSQDGYGWLASMVQANQLWRKGDTNAARLAYKNLAERKNLPDEWGVLARIMALRAGLLLTAGNPKDEALKGEIHHELANLTARKDGWADYAKLFNAEFLLQQGNKAEALAMLQQISQSNTADKGLKSHGEELAKMLGSGKSP